jgi:hypothetical protein
MLVAAVVLRVVFPEDADGGAVFAVIGGTGFLLVPLVGALIAARLPTNPYGWVWCGLALAFVVQFLLQALQRSGAVAGWLPAVVGGVAFAAGLCLLAFVLLLFPTGRLPSRGWRWPAGLVVVLTGIVILAVPFAPADVAADSPPWALGGAVADVLQYVLARFVPVMFVLLMVAAASVLVRFRRAGPVERQQLKWFVLGAVLMAATTAFDLLDLPISDPVWAVIDAVTFSLLPVAVAIAVLRYRLYEIDRIISRTVSYGLLTGGLIGLYLLLVTGLGPFLEPVTGNSSLAVAGSTLAVAAVFHPARRRLQAAVDRRFDRARYDAARAVDAFAARLRDQVDLDQVTWGLRDTVGATVAPSRIAVWIRDVPSAREA